jgi:hypothetical protein
MQGKANPLFQHQPSRRRAQRWRSGGTDSGGTDIAWLSMLVDCFEKTSQTDFRAAPCDELVLQALKAQLAQPASPRGACGLDFRFLN